MKRKNGIGMVSLCFGVRAIISAYCLDCRYKGRFGRSLLKKEDNSGQAEVSRRPADRHAQDFPDSGDIENDQRGQYDITVEDRCQAYLREIS